MSFQVRRYNADGDRMPFDMSKFVSMTYAVEKFGGYTDGTVPVVGNDIDDVDAEVTDRFELWDGGRRYRGYVTEVNPSEDEPDQMQIVLYGRMIDLTLLVLDARYAYVLPVDISVVFADIAADVQLVHPDITFDVQVVGVTIDTYDARGKTAEEALNDLVKFAAATACFGFDVDDDGADRLYLRVLDITTDATPNHVIGLQGPTIGKRSRRHSISDLFTEAVIEGGTPKYPQKLPNGSFEVLRASNENDGNLVQNPGFEESTGPTSSPHWAVNDGATIKTAEGGTSPRTGRFAGEIDLIAHLFSPSETIVQSDMTPTIPLKENNRYLFSFYAIPEANVDFGDPPVLRGKLSWLDAGGSTIVTDSAFYNAEVRYWQYNEITSYTPPFSSGLTGWKIEFIPESGHWHNDNGGVWIDDVTLSDATVLYAVGWGVVQNGTGAIDLINWAARPGYHGRTYLDIVVHGCDTGSNYVDLLTVPEYQIDVLPGEVYKLSFRYKSHYVDEAPAHMQLRVSWKDASGNDVSTPFSSAFSPSSIVTDWDYAATAVAVPSNAYKAIVKFRFVGDGGIKLDALSFRNNADTSDVYMPEGNLNLRFRCDEVVTSMENADVHDAYDTWGRRDKVISESLVTTVDEARQLAKVEFLDAARFIPEPQLIFVDDPRFIMPWETARFIGRKNANWQDGLSPITKVEGRVDADTRVETINFNRDRPTTEDILRRIIQEEARVHQDAGVGASGVGTAGGGGSSGGTGPAGPAGPPGADGADGSSLLYEPLTNGDAGSPELIFVDGDVVMVPVY